MPTYFFFFLHKQSKSRSNLMNSRKRNSQVITATKDHKWAGLHLNSFLTDRKNIDGFIFKSNVFEEFVILKIHLKKINMFQVNSSWWNLSWIRWDRIREPLHEVWGKSSWGVFPVQGIGGGRCGRSRCVYVVVPRTCSNSRHFNEANRAANLNKVMCQGTEPVSWMKMRHA